MNPGKLDRRVELQKFTLTTDGDPTSGTWATEVTVSAARMEKSQIERFISAADIAIATRVYRIRYYAAVEPSWRLKDGTELWDIEGAADGPGRNRETMLLCSRHDPGDDSG